MCIFLCLLMLCRFCFNIFRVFKKNVLIVWVPFSLYWGMTAINSFDGWEDRRRLNNSQNATRRRPNCCKYGGFARSLLDELLILKINNISRARGCQKKKKNKPGVQLSSCTSQIKPQINIPVETNVSFVAF